MPKTNRGRRPSPTKHPGHARQNFKNPEKQQEVRDQIFQSVQEMFEGKIEPEVVYLVLTEFDWKEENAIDSLFSLCGESVDTDAKQNKLAEIAAQVFGILESPDPVKFDTGDFPPLMKTCDDQSCPDSLSSKVSEDGAPDYDQNKGSNSVITSSAVNEGDQSRLDKTQSMSDKLRLELDSIRTKHMKSSNKRNQISMYGSWLSASGFGGQEVSESPKKSMIVGEKAETGNEIRLREHSLSPDRSTHGEILNSVSDRSRDRTLQESLISPVHVDSAFDDNLDLRNRTSGQVASVIGGELEAKKRQKGKERAISEISNEKTEVSKSIKSPAPVSVSNKSAETKSPQVTGSNPLSQSILSGTFQLSSQEETTPLVLNNAVTDRPNSSPDDHCSKLESELKSDKKSSMWPDLSTKKSKTEIDDDISEESFPEQNKGSSSYQREQVLRGESVVHRYSPFSDWSDNKGVNVSVFPSAYELKSVNNDSFKDVTDNHLYSEDSIFRTDRILDNSSKPQNFVKSLESEDLLDLNINELLSESCAITDNLSPDVGLLTSGDKPNLQPVNCSPNVWSPSRSTDTDDPKRLTAGLKKLLNIGEDSTDNEIQETKSDDHDGASSKQDSNSGSKENAKTKVDSKSKTYAKHAYSLEEIRADAAFSLSVDAPVFVPRFPAKEAIELPKPISAPLPEPKPQFMTPKCPVRMSQAPQTLQALQTPQNFMPRVLVQNMQQYRMPVSFPLPVIQHPLGLVATGKNNLPGVPVPLNPLLSFSAGNQMPQNTKNSYSSATKKQVPNNVPKKSASKKTSTGNTNVAVQLDQYTQSIKNSLQDGTKYMIIIRGIPGSGKTTLARQLKGNGKIFSTDDYFVVGGEYLYEKNLLSEAHEWNKNRVKKGLMDGVNPVVVDNTNTQPWEMKPYVKFALKYDYEVKFVEPETKWKYNTKECARSDDFIYRRSTHKVPHDTIKQMMDRYKKNVTVEDILKVTKEKDNVNMNNVDVVNDLPTEKLDAETTVPVQTCDIENDVDWSEDNEDFFMKDYNIVEESVDKLNAETFGLADDNSIDDSDNDFDDEVDEERTSLDNNNSALNEQKTKVVEENADVSVVSSSGKITPKPLQPLSQCTNRLDILSKRKFLVSPSLSVSNLSVPKSGENIKIDTQEISLQEIRNRSVISQENSYNVSSEVEEMVDDLITEHVGENLNSETDFNLILEELKVCLHLMPIESEQRPAVEKLIEQKLKIKTGYRNSDEGIQGITENDSFHLSNRGKYSDSDSTVGSLTPDGRLNVDDEQVMAKFGSENLSSSEDIYDKEIGFITEKLQKSLYTDDKITGIFHNFAITSQTESLSEKEGDSEVNLSYVMDHIERRLSDLGINPSPTELNIDDSTKPDLQNLSKSHLDEQYSVRLQSDEMVNNSNIEMIAVFDETEKSSVLKQNESCGYTCDEENQILSAELKYWNLLQVNNAETDANECGVSVVSGQQKVDTSEFMGSDSRQNITEDNSKSVLRSEENYWNKDTKFDFEKSDVGISSTNTCDSNKSSAVITQAENTMTPLSEAEAKYWGILTNNAVSSSESSSWSEEVESSENPKPKRIKHLSDNNSKKRNNSKSEADEITENNTDEVIISGNDDIEISNKVQENAFECSQGNIRNVETENTNKEDLKCDSREHSPPESGSGGGTSPENECNAIISKADLKTSDSQSNTTSPKRKKRNTKRKLAANFNVPFLEDSFKENLKQDWDFPSLQTFNKESKEIPHYQSEIPLKETSDQETSISDEDLRILNQVNGSHKNIKDFANLPYRVVCAREILCSRESSVVSDDMSSTTDETLSNTLAVKPVSVLMIDKSTSMEELSESGIEFLQNCFPSIREEELSQVLEQCNNNVQWAIDLMLEWKYHLYLSPDDKLKFVDAMLKVHHVPKEAMMAVPTSPTVLVRSPDSLFDMCMGFIELSGIALKENLEKQIIQSGYSRLNSIEEKIRRRMTSCEADQEIFIEDEEFNDSVLQELLYGESLESTFDKFGEGEINLSDIQNVNKGEESDSELQSTSVNESVQQHQYLSCHDSDTVAFFQNQDNILPNGLDSEVITSKENQFKPVRATPPLPLASNNSLETDTPLPLPHLSQAKSDSPDMVARSPDGLILTLNIPKEFALALLSLFGPVGSYSPGNLDNIDVPIDYRTARAIHACWTQNYHPDLVHNERQLRKDEAYAKKLQLEEEYAEIVRQEGDSEQASQGLPVSGPIPLVSTTVNAGVYGKIVKPQAVSLKDIMHEEKERELKKQKHLQALHASGTRTALATKLKQQKLYEAFPGIDELILDDIYEANSCNLENTIKAVKGSLADSIDCPQTVMTTEAVEAYEKKLIDAAEQQSLQEMLDSYLNRPKLNKTVQSGDQQVNFEDYRGEANIHYRLRHECFQKAQEAYSRGMKQVAVFYSEQGHQHTRKIKESNTKAADSILEHRNQQLQENSTLDLHGLHVDEALLALERILPQREIEIQTFPDKKKEYLVIITGRGSHSRGGISKLRPAVLGFLNRNKYRYVEVHVGVVKVSLKYRYKS